jgi:hypothetical protein
VKTLYLTKKKLELKKFVKRSALEADADLLIDEDTVIIDADTKEVVAIYKILDKSKLHNDVFRMLTKVNYGQSQRLSGLQNTGATKIFGFVPRNRVRTNDQACRLSKLATEQPKVHQKLLEYAKVINDIYKDNNEKRYNRHQELIKRVNDNYVIPDTLFTSGIVNRNNPLKYHYDSGNFSKVSSAMIGFKHNIEGGHLVLPEYGVKLMIQDRSISMFDGQEVLHGVTPIIKKSNDALRFTIVFYSLTGMWSCLPLDEEIANARMARWESELKKYDRKFAAKS